MADENRAETPSRAKEPEGEFDKKKRQFEDDGTRTRTWFKGALDRVLVGIMLALAAIYVGWILMSGYTSAHESLVGGHSSAPIERPAKPSVQRSDRILTPKPPAEHAAPNHEPSRQDKLLYPKPPQRRSENAPWSALGQQSKAEEDRLYYPRSAPQPKHTAWSNFSPSESSMAAGSTPATPEPQQRVAYEKIPCPHLNGVVRYGGWIYRGPKPIMCVRYPHLDGTAQLLPFYNSWPNQYVFRLKLSPLWQGIACVQLIYSNKYYAPILMTCNNDRPAPPILLRQHVWAIRTPQGYPNLDDVVVTVCPQGSPMGEQTNIEGYCGPPIPGYDPRQ